MKKFNIVTIFPDMFSPLEKSMIGKAIEKEIVSFNIVNPREYTENKHKKVDDYPFGGGPGMVMMAQPLFDALESLEQLENQDYDKNKTKIIYMSPRGRVLNQEKIKSLSEEEEITVICGHYEGVDQRVLDYFQVEEISIGDYVLTGGELPAMVMIDAICRMVPGVLASEGSVMEESIYSGLLEHGQYTQPRSYKGLDVPEILVGGNHRKIYLWKLEESLMRTAKVRPDLFKKFLENREHLDKDENKVLEKVLNLL